MKVDPYKILELNKEYNLEELEINYKYHMGKNKNSPENIHIIKECYIYLTDKYKNTYEKKRKINEIEKDIPKERNMKFDNNKFEKNLREEQNELIKSTERGYGYMMDKTQVGTKYEPIEIKKTIEKFTPDNFKKAFEKDEINETTKNNMKNTFNLLDGRQDPDKYNNGTMKVLSGLNFVDYNNNTVDDYSSGLNTQMGYTDYKKAYEITRFMDESLVEKRKEFKNVEEYEKYRS
jgi:hypothetical protein